MTASLVSSQGFTYKMTRVTLSNCLISGVHLTPFASSASFAVNRFGFPDFGDDRVPGKPAFGFLGWDDARCRRSRRFRCSGFPMSRFPDSSMSRCLPPPRASHRIPDWRELSHAAQNSPRLNLSS